MSRPFQFKQFVIHQEKSAMKVGTDGVLLGSWVQIDGDPVNILDIGTGTGLLAMMLAQRSNAMVIDAVEIDDEAYVEAVENFERSPWADRLFCYHATIQEFADELDEKYDLIVSNPPFFEAGLPLSEARRSVARNHVALSFKQLLQATEKLLSDEGSAAFVIPYDTEAQFLDMARQLEMYPQRITRVRGTASSPLKRSLIQLDRMKLSTVAQSELVLEVTRHQYTPEFKALVEDFYLKL